MSRIDALWYLNDWTRPPYAGTPFSQSAIDHLWDIFRMHWVAVSWAAVVGRE